MASSADIEKKMKAFRTIDDIVGAMKAYAGVTVRKTEESVRNVRVYEEAVLKAMSDIVSHHPYISPGQPRKGKRILLAFGSSQGFCGPFNEKMADAVAEAAASDDTVIVIGRRLMSLVEARSITLFRYLDSPVSINGIQTAIREAIVPITETYKKEGYYDLSFLFTIITENRALTVSEQVLPPEIERVRALRPVREMPYIYLEPQLLFDKLLEEFLYISLYRCYVESLRSENWYRLRSMEGASENLMRHITDLDSLQKVVRQEEITEEMLEILGGGGFYG